MSPLDLAMKYMQIFYLEGDLDKLRIFFDDNLQFDGPLYSFKSADEYLRSLKSDPPRDMNYEIIKTYEGPKSACLIYWFKKMDICIPMAQIFHTDDQKIKKILLIFDSAVIKR